MSVPRRLEDWIDGFLHFTEDTEPRETYRRWVGLSTIAAALQRKCWINWGRLIFYPNLYIVLVGPPAARKGTAMEPGRALLDALGIEMAADSGSWQKFLTSLEENIAIEQGPDGKNYYHSSVTIFSAELTVFLGYDNYEMLSVLCDWFDCRPRFVYDTFRGGRQEVPNVWANLIGATTPTQLRASLPEEAFGSGLTSRVIHVYEENKDKEVIKPEVTPEQARTEEGLGIDLQAINGLFGEFATTPKFSDSYTDWRKADITRNHFPAEPRLDHYVERRRVFIFKLAMVYCASRTNDMIIDEVDLVRAIESLEEVEKKMPLVFKGVGSNPLASSQTRMQNILRDKKEVRTGSLYELFANDLNHNQFREVLSGLIAMGFCTQDLMNKSDKGALIKLK